MILVDFKIIKLECTDKKYLKFRDEKVYSMNMK